MDPASLRGTWLLKGSTASTHPLLPVDAAEVVVIPQLFTSKMLQTLLSDVSSCFCPSQMSPRAGSFGQATGEPRVLCMLELGGPATHGELPVASSHCPVASPSSLHLSRGSCVLFLSCPLGERTGPTRLTFPQVVWSLNGSFLDSNDAWILKTAT